MPIRKVERKSAQAVSRTQRDSRRLKIDFHFVRSGLLWGCGASETTNGLIWQHYSKNRNFIISAQQEIDTAMSRLNNRPRNSFEYKTPSQAFIKLGVCFKLESALIYKRHKITNNFQSSQLLNILKLLSILACVEIPIYLTVR